MNFIKNNKAAFIASIALIIMLLSVLGWNYIVKKQKEPDDTPTNEKIDIGDVNNISSVEEKLGSDMKITQGYLLTYTRNKNKIWYKSQGIVKSATTNGTTTTITLAQTANDTKILTATIDSDKWEYQKGDTLNFVGTLNLSNKTISLSKLSKEEIDYKNVTEFELNKLIDNIELIKNNIFIINGYMVTDKVKYKLYDSKEAYIKDPSVGNYFTISWKETFNYTGNQNVTIKCKLEDTYKLNECELQTK